MSDLEKQILKDFYDFNEGKRNRPSLTEYNFKYKGNIRAKNEFAYYLIKLEREGYLRFDDSKVIVPGGIRDEEYNNSVAMIYTDSVETTDKTEMLFTPKRIKVGKVLKAEGKDFGKTVNSEVKGYFAKWVAGFIILGILSLIIIILGLFD